MRRMATTETTLSMQLPWDVRLLRCVNMLVDQDGLSQEQFGEVINLSRTQAGRKLNGHSDFSLNELYVIAEHFGVNVSDLWHPDRISLRNSSNFSVISSGMDVMQTVLCAPGSDGAERVRDLRSVN